MATKIDPKFKKGISFMLKKVPVKWAAIHQPDTKFEEQWKINAVLTPSSAKELQDAGFNVKIDADGDSYIQVSSKTTQKGGKANQPPRVVGPDGKTPFTENVGNGSVCNIAVFAKEWNASGKTGIKAYLNAVQVLEHVPYAGGSGFDDESGSTEEDYGKEESPF